IVSEFALIEGGFALWVNVLDRVFEGDDVDRLGRINLVENRRQSSGLAAAGRACDQNKSGFFLRDLVKNFRQSQLLNRRDLALQFAKHDRKVPLLLENVHAKTRLVTEGVTAIAGAAGEIIVNEAAIALHKGERNLLSLVGRQRLDRWIDIDRFQLAKILDLERMTDRKV